MTPQACIYRQHELDSTSPKQTKRPWSWKMCWGRFWNKFEGGVEIGYNQDTCMKFWRVKFKNYINNIKKNFNELGPIFLKNHKVNWVKSKGKLEIK